MEQAKRRDKKVYITDIAIDKVPFIQYDGFTDERNRIMQELAKDVLLLSKEKNDNNEVAITCDLGAENPLGSFGISLDTEHEVDILADTLSNHIIVSKESVAVVVLHNYPSTQKIMAMAATGEMMRGTVKWFDVRKGFGFITDEDGVDWYVHFSNINMDGFKKLRPGQEVSFITEDDEHGRSAAKEVTILEEAV